MGIPSWIATEFPVRVGMARLEVVDARPGARDTVITYRLVVCDDAGVVRDLKEQEFTHRDLDEAGVRMIAARAHARLTEVAEPECVMPRDLVRPHHQYERVPSRALPAAVVAQALAGSFDERFERLDDWPVEPRTVYFLDLALTMISGNGCQVFLAQHDLEDIVGVLTALNRADCPRFVAVYRTALTLAHRDGRADFLETVDPDWLESQLLEPVISVSWRELDTHLDGGTYFLLEAEVRPALARYINEHRSALALDEDA